MFFFSASLLDFLIWMEISELLGASLWFFPPPFSPKVLLVSLPSAVNGLLSTLCMQRGSCRSSLQELFISRTALNPRMRKSELQSDGLSKIAAVMLSLLSCPPSPPWQMCWVNGILSLTRLRHFTWHHFEIFGRKESGHSLDLAHPGQNYQVAPLVFEEILPWILEEEPIVKPGTRPLPWRISALS